MTEVRIYLDIDDILADFERDIKNFAIPGCDDGAKNNPEAV